MMLPTGRFAVIYADPPWQFRSWSDKGRNRCPDAMVRQKGLAERHYKVMSVEDIKDLPVRGLALPDSALFLWVVSCNLKDGLAVSESWGFEFKTIAFVWSKTVLDGSRPAIGLGYWTRQSVEVCLLFTRGSPRRLSAGVRQFHPNSPRGALSEARRGI